LDKAAVFIDGGYLARVLEKEFNGIKIDFGAFSNKICKDVERLKTYYYYCMPYQSNPPTEEERKRYATADRFMHALKRLPRFEVRLGKLVYRDGEFTQKRVDVLLAVDLVRMSWDKQINRAILVTGDSDFVPPVLAANEAGVLTILYYSPNSCHDELLETCGDKIKITDKLLHSVMLKK